jgi:hypothetical protein
MDLFYGINIIKGSKEREKIIELVKHFIVQGIFNLDLIGGIFFSRNVVGDPMSNFFTDENTKISLDVCYPQCYFEVFGLTRAEQDKIEKYYYEKLALKNKDKIY